MVIDGGCPDVPRVLRDERVSGGGWDDRMKKDGQACILLVRFDNPNEVSGRFRLRKPGLYSLDRRSQGLAGVDRRLRRGESERERQGLSCFVVAKTSRWNLTLFATQIYLVKGGEPLGFTQFMRPTQIYWRAWIIYWNAFILARLLHSQGPIVL
jgi:hypothetical protein